MKSVALCVAGLCAAVGAAVLPGCMLDFSTFERPYLGPGDDAASDSPADSSLQAADGAPDGSATDATQGSAPDATDAPPDPPVDAEIDGAIDAPPPDSSDAPSGCGTLGLACCAGNSCGSGLACSRGTCTSACGASGEPCCPGGMCTGTTCNTKKNICR
jgi:hypothetical protein